MGELTPDPASIALLRGVYAAACRVKAPDTLLVPSLRYLFGRSSAAQSILFHFDSYVLTTIVPIIPTEGKTGSLVTDQNTRSVRRTYLTNFVDKMVTDNPRAAPPSRDVGAV